ncbi:hypothetical protein GN958_ATG21732, partial [Phytophthora infestans]
MGRTNAATSSALTASRDARARADRHPARAMLRQSTQMKEMMRQTVTKKTQKTKVAATKKAATTQMIATTMLP